MPAHDSSSFDPSKMYSQEIRRNFLNYFQERQHQVVPSSPVVPYDDPTLLFTNAGMNQFKDFFLGKRKPDYLRAASSQKCIRAGGKHNDLENVGHTSRHTTFFEMLGNFSFGDYFKKDAIQFAWEVSTKVFGFDPERIWPTVYHQDDEAFELWTAYVPANKITRFGEKENFWAMGDVGPCGPCSELLYDRGEHYGSSKNPTEDTSGERFLEFWNLVFMQYNRSLDGKQELLPRPSIDTGAGLERVLSLKMGVESVFETDILRGLINQVEKLSGKTYSVENNRLKPAFRVIADHLRTLSFAIADGAQPSNVDRGYVLRKILRRAVRYGKMLGFETPFLAKVYPRLILLMGNDYPELKQAQSRIEEILTLEEESFFRTLRRGGALMNQVLENAKNHKGIIAGDDAFKLKDTYGLPLEEIQLIATDSDCSVDIERYKVLEEEAKARSRTSHKASHQVAKENLFASHFETVGPSKFVGYSQLTAPGKITGIVVDGQFVDQLNEGQKGILVLDTTSFYPEMGGQIGDKGVIEAEGALFKVEDCLQPYKGVIAHHGSIDRGSLRVGDPVKAMVDITRRQKIANNHTATHLLHWALHQVLGDQIKQAGSVVEPTRLRFDFSYHKPLTPQELRQVEDIVNRKIRDNLTVSFYDMPYEQAQKRTDIKQFFGDKYGAEVRVVDIDFSKELCGGTHVQSLGFIGLFRITKESSIAAGVRRIEAVTGEEAEAFSRQSEETLFALSNMLKAQPHQLLERVEKLVEEQVQLTKELKKIKKLQIQSETTQLVKSVKVMNGIPLLTARLQCPIEDLKGYLEVLSESLPSAVVALGAGEGDRCQILVRVSDDLVQKSISAHKIVQGIAPLIAGSGGGKPGNAQAGGKDATQLDRALQQVSQFLWI